MLKIIFKQKTIFIISKKQLIKKIAITIKGTHFVFIIRQQSQKERQRTAFFILKFFKPMVILNILHYIRLDQKKLNSITLNGAQV